MARVVTTAAFDAAMERGDVATIREYFLQPDVLAMVAETEARVVRLRENGGVDMTRLRLPNGARPWFRRPGKAPIVFDELPLVSAARRSDVDVLAWFFSRENAHRMGATLTMLFALVASFRDHRYPSLSGVARPLDPLVLETLLTSHVFSELFSAEQKQSVLDSIACLVQSPPMLEVAIAHGARLNSAASVVAFYGEEALGNDMSFLVGGDVLVAPSRLWDHAAADDSFLMRGDEAMADRLVNKMHTMATTFQSARYREALAEGFFDADARDRFGRTLLMNSASYPNASVEMVELLLSYNADLTLVDESGWSALDHAFDNKELTELLLERGAIPMQALDGIIENVYEWRNWRTIVTLSLQRGADPLEPRPRLDPSGREWSLYDRLHEREEGRAFMRDHPQFFALNGHTSPGCL